MAENRDNNGTMNHRKDYYKTLGIEPDATLEEVKRAYRQLAILNHPDKNPTHQAATIMQEVNEAYGVLGHDRKRKNYDHERRKKYAEHQTPAATPETLEQVFYTKPGMGTAVKVLMIYAALTAGMINYYYYSRYYIRVIGLSILGLIVSFFLIQLLNFIEVEKKEKQCPQCRQTWAAEKRGEKIAGIFQKRARLRNNSEDRYITYQKYRIHYRCRYCAYEWLYINTKRL